MTSPNTNPRTEKQAHDKGLASLEEAVDSMLARGDDDFFHAFKGHASEKSTTKKTQRKHNRKRFT